MRRAALRAMRRRRRFSDALPAASGGVGVSPAVRDQTQFEQLRAEAFARRSRPDMAALVKCGSLHEAVAEVDPRDGGTWGGWGEPSSRCAESW